MLQAMEWMEKKCQKTTTSSCSTVKKAKTNAKVVTQARRSVKSLISEKTKETCECELCKSGEVCSTSLFVYRADSKQLGDQYIGASRRPLKNRHPEHESSYRLNNSRTTLRQHASEHCTENKDEYRPKAGTRDFEKFLEYHDFSIVRKCKDSLETYINEGMLISIEKPKLNSM